MNHNSNSNFQIYHLQSRDGRDRSTLPSHQSQSQSQNQLLHQAMTLPQIPEPYPTKCYCWGSGAGGALGGIKVQLTPKRFDLAQKQVASVWAGDRRTIAVMVNGDAYSWGSNPLGRKCTTLSSRALAKKINTKQIEKVSQGNNHTVLLTSLGHVFSFGDATNGKLGLKNKRRGQVDLPQQIVVTDKCVDVACGCSTTSLLLESGEIVTFGLTGLSNSLNRREKVQEPISFHLPVKIISISSGTSHCVAISSDGHCFTWGVAENGRLGHGGDDNDEILSAPTRVEYLWEQEIVVIKAACGAAHSCVVTNNGELYSFGWNLYFQCSSQNETNEDVLIPTIVGVGYETVDSISCGFAHCAFITTSGKLYCFGFNEDYQLGIGHDRNTASPTFVTFEDDEAKCIIDVSCGNLHTVAVAAACTISEFVHRQHEIESTKNAIRILHRFGQYAILQRRLETMRSKRISSQYTEEKLPLDENEGKYIAGVQVEDLDASSEYSDDSLGSIDFVSSNDIGTKSNYTSRITEMLAMEGEEALSIEFLRKLNSYRNDLDRKKMKILVETVRRFETVLMMREDEISNARRQMKGAAIDECQRQMRMGKIGKRNIRAQQQIQKVADQRKAKEKMSLPKPRIKPPRNTRSIGDRPVVLYRKKTQPSTTIPKAPILPSRNKNKKLLQQRKERLARKERERREEEQRQNRIQQVEESRLRRVREKEKRIAMIKVQKINSMLKTERAKSSRTIVKLKEEVHPRGLNCDNDDNRKKDFRSVKQWSRGG